MTNSIANLGKQPRFDNRPLIYMKATVLRLVKRQQPFLNTFLFVELVGASPQTPEICRGMTTVPHDGCSGELSGIVCQCLEKRREALWRHNFSRDIQDDGAPRAFPRASVASPQALVLLGSVFQSSSFLINVLRIVSNFLIAATRATFLGLPLASRR